MYHPEHEAGVYVQFVRIKSFGGFFDVLVVSQNYGEDGDDDIQALGCEQTDLDDNSAGVLLSYFFNQCCCENGDVAAYECEK